ncbi:hypothetical protein KTO58_19220 [Chitinophaga pendula]|uniref:hypothetical protein n=1 Tax=Chitinophaga TaxID=79328 RepID=UPI000BAF5B46|nr:MULTISPECIES: hypothetical protein [Chitinophaga]ASZ11195.1 hypothetical protein CK934_09585 [Chitinophaga sp. MD30]UCJ05807.1 hypothetical protein KTO58_19220 [Chitinophaga pendula]
MSNIKLLGLFVLLIIFNACSKETAQTKAINIEVWGYNVGDAILETSIDTTVYRNFITLPNKPVTFSKVYTYPSAKKEVSVTIKNKISGAALYRQQINLETSELELFFPFVLINGNVLKVEPATADLTTNKLGFYIHYPQSDAPLDIFLKNDAGQMVYIARNVKPGSWIYANYLPQEGFKDKSKSYTLYFTQTGATDSWYFEDSEAKSKVDEFGLTFPKGEEKGLVRTYFVTPGDAQLEVMRLFKRPKTQ